MRQLRPRGVLARVLPSLSFTHDEWTQHCRTPPRQVGFQLRKATTDLVRDWSAIKKPAGAIRKRTVFNVQRIKGFFRKKRAPPVKQLQLKNRLMRKQPDPRTI